MQQREAKSEALRAANEPEYYFVDSHDYVSTSEQDAWTLRKEARPGDAVLTLDAETLCRKWSKSLQAAIAKLEKHGAHARALRAKGPECELEQKLAELEKAMQDKSFELNRLLSSAERLEPTEPLWQSLRTACLEANDTAGDAAKGLKEAAAVLTPVSTASPAPSATDPSAAAAS